MSTRTFCCLALLLSLLGWQPGHAALPPVPDSLRPLLTAARTPATRQAVLLRVASAWLVAGDSAGTMAYAAAAAQLARSRADSTGLGRALSLRGGLLLLIGNPEAAAPSLRRAERLLAAAPPAWQADNLASLAWLLGDTNQPAAALGYLRRAHALYGRLGNQLAQASLSGTASVIYLYQGFTDSAVYVLQRAARQQHALHNATEEITTLGNLATMLHQAGRLPEAETYALQVLQLAPPGTDVSATHQTLGNIYMNRHRPALALAHYRTCLQLLLARHAEGQATTCYGSMASAFTALHQPDSSIYYHRRAVRLCQQLGQTTQAAIEMGALALVYGSVGRWPEAEYWAHASLAAEDPRHWQSGRAWYLLTKAAEHRGDYRAALGYMRRYHAIDTARFARLSQRQLQEQRTRFDTDRAEQQVALLTARTQTQAQEQELTRLRTRQERATVGALLLLLLAAAGLLFARYRRRQAATRAAAAQALRQRLAADLHDDVGNLLTQISMQSSLLREAPGSPAQLLARLDQLTTTARQATQQMSDVVWGLHQTQQTLPELLDRMRDHAHEVLYPLGLEVDFAANPAATAAQLAPETLQSLYLIYKEALHNVVKHAQATRVTVRLDASPTGLHLTVADDGQGHDGTPRPGGNGLRNMQTRAQAVGGNVQYKEAAPGCRVVVELPTAVPA